MPKGGKKSRSGTPHPRGRGRGAGAGGDGGGRRLLTTDEKVVRVPPAAQAMDKIRVRMAQTLVSDMIGRVTWQISGDVYAGVTALLAASPDFVAVSSLWLEYQVKEARVVLLPRDRYSKLTTVTCAVAIGFDQISFAPMPNWLTSLEFGTTRLMSLDDPGELTYAIPQNAKGLWYQFGVTPAVVLGAFFAATPTTVTPSTTYMDVIFEFTLMVRGRT